MDNRPHLQPFQLLPAKSGTCPECAAIHEPEEPHNRDSLFYQYDFYGKHGRWPTWLDALSHCAPKMKENWIQELAARGKMEGN